MSEGPSVQFQLKHECDTLDTGIEVWGLKTVYFEAVLIELTLVFKRNYVFSSGFSCTFYTL